MVVAVVPRPRRRNKLGSFGGDAEDEEADLSLDGLLLRSEDRDSGGWWWWCR